jgi:hypothetical protein
MILLDTVRKSSSTFLELFADASMKAAQKESANAYIHMDVVHQFRARAMPKAVAIKPQKY